jgi:hypothetical protein
MSTSLYELYIEKSAIVAGGTLMNYTPPDIQWYSASGITIPAGRYYQIGSRTRNQYDSFDLRGNYWDISSPFNFTLSSGIIDNGLVANSWYSVFLTGNTINSVKILPFIRAYSVDYNVSYAGKTSIVPGMIDVSYWGTQVKQNSYINSNDSWNGYRLRKWPNNLKQMWVDREILTIEDTVDGSTDYIVIDGNKTSTTVSGQALQLLPPTATPHLYLGVIWVDASKNITRFLKTGWNYTWTTRSGITSNKGVVGGAANTFLSGAVPPNATKVKMAHFAGEDDTNSAYGHYTWFYSGDTGESSDTDQPTGNNTHNLWNYYSYNTQWKRSRQTMEFNLTNNQCIRNLFSRWNGSAWAVPEFGLIDVYGWSE